MCIYISILVIISVKKRKAYKGAQPKMPVALPSKQLFIRPIDNETKYFTFTYLKIVLFILLEPLMFVISSKFLANFAMSIFPKIITPKKLKV